MDKVVRIDFLEYEGFPKRRNLIFDLLSERHQIEIDEVSPDYVFVGPPWMYEAPPPTYSTDPVRIFWQTEANMTDFNLFDYAILRYDDIRFGDRCFFRDYEWWWDAFVQRLDGVDERKRREVPQRKRFANFIYSHASAERDDFFEKLHRRQPVEALGRHLNNVGPLDDAKGRYGTDFFSTSIELKSSYRFSVAFENRPFAVLCGKRLGRGLE